MAVFKSLKDNYSKTVRSLTFAKPSIMVTKREFSKVIRVRFERAFSITNIKAGFAKCGIYPFNPDAIQKAKIVSSPACGESSTDQSTTSSRSQTPIQGDSSSALHSTPASVNSSSSTTFPDSASSIAGATASSSEVSAVSPSPVVSPLDSQNSSGVFCSTPTLNPLVKAGLIPPDLVDILATPPTTSEPTMPITDARELTVNEYYEWLHAEELKKKKAAEEKQRRSEECQ